MIFQARNINMAEIKRLKYCINNEWLASATGKYMPVMNPSTGVQIAEAPCCTQDEVDAALSAAGLGGDADSAADSVDVPLQIPA